MIIKCDNCGREVNHRPAQIKINLNKGGKNYCSKNCSYLGQTKGKICNCANCGKEIYRMQSTIKASKTGNVFCSKSCSATLSNLNKFKEFSKNWKGGNSLYIKEAYNFYKKECSICGYDDENALEVHHIDEDRSNNNIDNLIILCANHHSIVHRRPLEITDEIKNNRKLL